jgi:hypothetical protein
MKQVVGWKYAAQGKFEHLLSFLRYFDHVAKLGLGRNFEVNVLKAA